MRFTNNGPDIPKPLLRDLRRGDVMFIVGAGFSKPAGLPMFGELAELIYERLGQALPGRPGSLATAAELEALEKQQYDRLIGLLEHRLVYKGTGWRQPTNSVRDTAAELLRIPARTNLDSQCDLLDLSRGLDGRPRLITTNFDTLFERAWYKTTRKRLPSSAGPGMPPVGSHDFAGVLHLHGRLEDRYLRLERTDLVLTAPNFGEAYMRSGWAARTVYDLLRRYTIVLIGYRADDPPMRYMLEATEEGRLNFPDLKPAYAFVPNQSADEGSTLEQWRAKGLHPIIYDPDDGHRALYDSVREWAASVRDPTQWAASQVAQITGQPFAESTAEDRTQVAYLAHEVASIPAVAKIVRDPAWIEALSTDDYKIDEWAYQVWFFDRLENSDAAEYAGSLPPEKQAMIVPGVARALYWRNGPLSEPFDTFWRLFIQAASSRDGDIPLRPSRRGTSKALASAHVFQIADSVAPRLSVHGLFHWPKREPPQPPLNIHSLARFEFQASSREWQNVLERVPQNRDSELRLLKALDRRLSDSLETAADAGLLSAARDLFSHDLTLVHEADPGEPLVEANDRHSSNWRLNQPDSYNSRFAPLLRMMTAVWARLHGHDAKSAARIAGDWAERDEMIYKRLGAWAAVQSGREPFRVMEDYLRRVTRARYWFTDNNPEVVRFYCRCWSKLHATTRAAIERAILAGPSVSFVRRVARSGHKDYVKSLYITRELTRIRTAGGRLSRSTSSALRRMWREHPDLPKTMPLYANLVSPGWSGSGYSANTRVLADVADEDLIATAQEIAEVNLFDQRDLWPAFVASEPKRAYAALWADLAKGNFSDAAWSPFLSHYGFGQKEPGRPETPPLSKVLDTLLSLDDAQLATLLRSLVRVLEANVEISTKNVRGRILKLWDKLLPLASRVEPDDGRKPLSEEILNHPVSELAACLLAIQWKARRKANGGFNRSLGPRFETLVGLEGEAARLARAALGRSIHLLDYLDPLWTERCVFSPMLESGATAQEFVIIVADSGAMRWGRIFNRCKPALLDALEDTGLAKRAGSGLSGALLTAAFAVIDKNPSFSLTRLEARRALTRMPNDLLASLAWELASVLRGEKKRPEKVWAHSVEPFLKEFWPNDVAARTEAVSRNLAHLPALAGSAFERATEVILGLVVPIQLHDIGYGIGLEEEQITHHPRACLELATALIDRETSAPSDLPDFLSSLLTADPAIGADPQFWRLRQMQRTV